MIHDTTDQGFRADRSRRSPARLTVAVLCASLLGALGGVPASAEAREVKECTDTGFVQEILDGLNKERSHHGVPALKISQELTDYAKTRAVFHAENGSLSHKELDTRYGENVFLASSDDSRPTPAGDAVTHWKNEQERYEYDAAGPAPGTENFTQMVWKASTAVGVGRACVLAPESEDPGWTYIVAIYRSRGNIPGEYRDNVLRGTD